MLPLIAQLVSAGLGPLANALANKGKEVVEEKLGVKLPSLSEEVSSEKLVELRQIQFDHEEKLIALANEKAKTELEEYKVEVADKDSARKRDVAFLAAGVKNYRADVMFVLAVIVIVMLVWIVWKDASINEFVKGVFTLVLGRFLGYLDNIYNYEFGTTRGSRSKDATIESLSKGGDK